MTYLISTFLLSLILITKLFFVFGGKGQPPGLLDFASLGILVGVLLYGTLDYLKKRKLKKHDVKIKSIDRLLIFACLIIIVSSFLISFNKKGVLWDSVALYDARAKFLIEGVNFSQMVDLSKYDPQNSYYYVLYPPHTSIVHYYWYKLGIPAPVAVFYSMLLVFLTIIIFDFSIKKIGLTKALLLSFLVISNGVVFSSSVAEYTNLPFTLQMLLGVILLYEYIEKNEKWKLFYGAGLVVTTMWIRFLEPVWLGVGIALLVALYLKKKFTKDLVFPILVILYGVLEYVSWQSFVSGFGEATKIVNFSLINFIEPIVGIFTGSAFSIFMFFVKSWGSILIVYLFAILMAFVNRKKLSFLQIFLLLTMFIYYIGLYFVSFQSTWWATLGGSLTRGSTFMLPISAYIVLEYLHEKKT